MMQLGAVNYFAVLAAAIVAMVLGFVWYGPLFGKKWAKYVGVSEKEMMKGMPMAAVGGFVTVLISSFVLAHFVSGLALGGSLFVSVLFWLAFMLPKAAGVVLWQGKSVELFLIDASHDLVGLLLMSAVIVLLG